MANESLSAKAEVTVEDAVKLTTIAPIVVFPLYKTNKAKKLRPSLMTGFSFSVPKNFELKKKTGELYEAKIKSN